MRAFMSRPHVHRNGFGEGRNSCESVEVNVSDSEYKVNHKNEPGQKYP